jgi:hypothetical protein
MSIAKDLLYQLAVENGLDALELVKYVDEDQLGGYHWNAALSKWNVGSVFESEGQMLYALVRYLKPQTIVEIGSFHGCSTAHMALALKANGKGKIVAVDDVRNGAFHDQYPEELKSLVEMVVSEGSAYLATVPPGSIDFVFEDSSHSEEDTYQISKAALQALIPGGFLINHDAMHDKAFDGNGSLSTVYEGAAIRAGLTRAGANFKTYIAPPIAKDSDCGIAVTRKIMDASMFMPSSVGIAPIESENVLKPSDDAWKDLDGRYSIAENVKPQPGNWQGDYIADNVPQQVIEPLASEEDKFNPSDQNWRSVVGGDDEPLAKEDRKAPYTPILDQFDRASEEPPPSTNWTNLNTELSSEEVNPRRPQIASIAKVEEAEDDTKILPADELPKPDKKKRGRPKKAK